MNCSLPVKLILLLGIFASLPYLTFAQEDAQAVYYAKKYIELNITSSEKSNKQVSKTQDRLLSKLKKKEKRVASKLKHKDCVAYSRLKANPNSFDSISNYKKKSHKPLNISRRTNATIDTLKGVKKFIERKAHVVGEGKEETKTYDKGLAGIASQSALNDDVTNKINARVNFLKSINKSKKGEKLVSLKSIEKTSFYNNKKIKRYKEIAKEPSNAEDLALEYLQGKEGFDKSLNYTEGNSLSNLTGKNVTAADLEKMGFQTKRLTSENLTKKMGKNNLSALQKNMGGQVQDFQDKISDVKETVRSTKKTKSSINSLKNTNKPSFRINPMRGLPFKERLDFQYNWQTTRATIDGKPAITSFSYMVGFKHTPKLSYGTGLALSVGLGQNWNNIRFTFQGVGLRTYLSYQLIYGIGAYAGYERLYKNTVFLDDKGRETIQLNETPHDKKLYSEAVLIGLTKAYKINDKWNGSIQVLYDIWWKEKGLRSPIQLRFATMKN